MSRTVDPRLEIGVCLGIVVTCGFVLIEAAGIPPGFFEPLGSAPVPTFTCWAIIALCTLIIVQAMPKLFRPLDDASPVRDHWLDMALVFLVTVAYVAALHLRMTTFAIMTTVYLLATIGVLTRFRRRLWLSIAAVALITGFGTQYVFTRIFIVDLPGL